MHSREIDVELFCRSLAMATEYYGLGYYGLGTKKLLAASAYTGRIIEIDAGRRADLLIRSAVRAWTLLDEHRLGAEP